MVLFMIFIYAPLAHWTWHPNGFLRNWGVLDFAGGTVVHMSAGMAALAGAFFFGPRRDYARPSYPANIPFVLLGTGLLWFGWFGFNAGSALEAIRCGRESAAEYQYGIGLGHAGLHLL